MSQEVEKLKVKSDLYFTLGQFAGIPIAMTIIASGWFDKNWGLLVYFISCVTLQITFFIVAFKYMKRRQKLENELYTEERKSAALRRLGKL